MSSVLQVTGYDLSDEGPGRTVNEDATLVRADLGLFALADGAGGRGRGNVAATLALRSVENYVGATVKRTHERPDFDLLGNHEQAKRLSAAVHQAHANLLEVIRGGPDRVGMASTIVALLFCERTRYAHVAHVGDSRCYRLRHGRLELLTDDHTVASDVLERKPELGDEVLINLRRNSVVRALGMDQELRVGVRSFAVIPGDRFLLASDGLTGVVQFEWIEQILASEDTQASVASELLSHALALHSADNISLLVVDCVEQNVNDDGPTRRYNEIPLPPPSAPIVVESEGPNSANLYGPEIIEEDLVASLAGETISERARRTSSFPSHPDVAGEASRAFEPRLLSFSDEAETLRRAQAATAGPRAVELPVTLERALAALDREDEDAHVGANRDLDTSPGDEEPPLVFEPEISEVVVDELEPGRRP